jgi:hypothetical protein
MMKRFTLRALPLAVAAATGAAAVLSGPAHATDPAAPAGSSSTGSGQIATTYYIAQPAGGWYTLLNMTNTSNAALAVKVRLKEFKNSREALDFVVMLSPHDVWTASVSQIGDDVYVRSTDTSCVAPYQAYQTLTKPNDPLDQAANGVRLRTSAFYDGADANYPAGLLTSDDGGSMTIAEAKERVREGHVEFVVMGECIDDTQVNAPPNNRTAGACFGAPVVAGGNTQPPGIGWLTEHVEVGGDPTDRQPRDCKVAADYFLPRNVGPLATGAAITNPNGDPIAAGNNVDNPALANNIGYQPITASAPIKVNVAYVQVGDGSGASIEALHLDNVIDPGNLNLITAQDYPWNLEPTIATAPSGTLWDMRGLLNLEQQFTWTDTFNEWSVNPAPNANVKTSIIVNMPTKAYHVDQTCNDIFASNNRWRWNGAAILACANPQADPPGAFGGRYGADYSPGVGTGNPDGTRNGAANPPSIAPFTNRWANGESPITLYYNLWDREEGFPPGGDVSPGGYKFDLPWEVAQIVFSDDGGALSLPLPSPSEFLVTGVDDLPSGSQNGWINIAFDFDNTFLNNGVRAGYAANQGQDIYGQAFAGLPVQALLVKTRTLGGTGLYGQGTNNGFKYCQYGPQAPIGTIPQAPAAPNTLATGWACNPNP